MKGSSMNLRRFLFLLFACCALGPPLTAQTYGPFTFKSSSSPCATVSVQDKTSTVGITVNGTFSLTLQPEVAVAGQAAANTQVTPSTSTTAQSTITAAGVYSANVGGYTTFLVCITGYVSGTATVYMSVSTGLNASLFGGGGGGGGGDAITSPNSTLNVGGTSTNT